MEYQPLSGLNRAVRWLLAAKIGLQIIAVFSGLFLYFAYLHFPADGDINEVFLPEEGINAVVGLVQTGFGAILVGIVFLWWLYRINRNLHALEPEAMEFTPGWAVGWYFVPIANLFKPYQVMKEIWNVTHGEPGGSPHLVSLWWTLWILSNVLSKAALKLSLRAESLSDYQAATIIHLLADAADVVLNGVVLVMIGRIWRACEGRYGVASKAAAEEKTGSGAF